MFSFCAPLEVPEVKTRTKMINACEWPEQGDSTYTQFAVYSTLVAGWQGGEKHSVHWWVGQPFDARNPGTLQCRCCRLIVLWSTGWGEVLQDRTFWVLEAEQWNRHKQSGWKSIPYSAVLMHPTGKALCLAHVRSCMDLSGSGSHSSKRKGKNCVSFTEVHQMIKMRYRDKGPIFLCLDEKKATEGCNFTLQLQRRLIHALLDVHREKLRSYKWVAGKMST